MWCKVNLQFLLCIRILQASIAPHCCLTTSLSVCLLPFVITAQCRCLLTRSLRERLVLWLIALGGHKGTRRCCLISMASSSSNNKENNSTSNKENNSNNNSTYNNCHCSNCCAAPHDDDDSTRVSCRVLFGERATWHVDELALISQLNAARSSSSSIDRHKHTRVCVSDRYKEKSPTRTWTDKTRRAKKQAKKEANKLR